MYGVTGIVGHEPASMGGLASLGRCARSQHSSVRDSRFWTERALRNVLALGVGASKLGAPASMLRRGTGKVSKLRARAGARTLANTAGGAIQFSPSSHVLGAIDAWTSHISRSSTNVRSLAFAESSLGGRFSVDVPAVENSGAG